MCDLLVNRLRENRRRTELCILINLKVLSLETYFTQTKQTDLRYMENHFFIEYQTSFFQIHEI